MSNQETATTVKHSCISCGVNLSIYGGPSAACDHGLLCEICRDSSECPACAKAEEDERDAEGMPRCPDCDKADFPTVTQYDYGRDSETGYSDSGERGTCKHCGANNDIGDWDASVKPPQRKPATPASATPDMQQRSK